MLRSRPHRSVFEAVLDGLDAAVFVADAHTDEILYANHAFMVMHGFDAVGRTVRAVSVAQPERSDYLVDPRNLGPADLPRELFDGELRHPLGRWYHVRERATAGRRACSAHGDRDRHHGPQAHGGRRASTGRAAPAHGRLITMGEMARRWRMSSTNPGGDLHYASGCASSDCRSANGTAGVLAAMQKAVYQAERAGKIIRRIRDFVRKSEPRRLQCCSRTSSKMIGFAEIDAVGRCQVGRNEPGMPRVFADRIMIEQAVLNLVRNGIDATSEGHNAVFTTKAAVIDRGGASTSAVLNTPFSRRRRRYGQWGPTAVRSSSLWRSRT